MQTIPYVLRNLKLYEIFIEWNLHDWQLKKLELVEYMTLQVVVGKAIFAGGIEK